MRPARSVLFVCRLLPAVRTASVARQRLLVRKFLQLLKLAYSAYFIVSVFAFQQIARSTQSHT